MLMATPAHAAGEFITTWKTDNEGTSASNQITIPTSDGFVYDYNVDWGDGSTSTDVTGNITHTYAEAGTYTVSISGTFPMMVFGYGGDKLKLLSINQWGTSAWQSFDGAYFGCLNLSITAEDVPDLSNVGSMVYAFRSSGLTTEDLSGWDMSSVTATLGMFQDTLFNGNVSTWDVSNVVNAQAMFINDPVFNQDVSAWNFASATNLGELFYQASAFNQDLSGWNVSNVTSMSGMFAYASSFNQDLSAWDVGSVTSMASMFYEATAFNQDLSDWDVSSVTTMADMLEGAALSMTNYDALLTGWAAQVVQPSVSFDAGDVTYCALSAHNVLTAAPNGWTMTDAGNICLIQAVAMAAQVTLDNAVYYFTASELVDEMVVAETGVYSSSVPTCGACTVLIDSVNHQVTFSGLQIGDELSVTITFTRANTLQIGPTTIIHRRDSGGTISGGVATSAPTYIPTPMLVLPEPTVQTPSAAIIQPSMADLSMYYDTDRNQLVAPLTTKQTISPYSGQSEAISEIQAGWFVRGEHYDTVYFITDQGTRRPFWDPQTFFTWSDSFDRVVWVTDATLKTLLLAAPVLPKPGRVLVKLPDDPTVYVIVGDSESIVRPIPNEDQAIIWFGTDWSDAVIDIAPTVFARFQKGDILTGSEQFSSHELKKRVLEKMDS